MIGSVDTIQVSEVTGPGLKSHRASVDLVLQIPPPQQDEKWLGRITMAVGVPLNLNNCYKYHTCPGSKSEMPHLPLHSGRNVSRECTTCRNSKRLFMENISLEIRKLHLQSLETKYHFWLPWTDLGIGCIMGRPLAVSNFRQRCHRYQLSRNARGQTARDSFMV